MSLLPTFSEISGSREFVIFLGYLWLLATSGPVVGRTLKYIGKEPTAGKEGGQGEQKCETVLFQDDAQKVIILTREQAPQEVVLTPTDFKIGLVLGKCENILIMTLVLLQGYTALALIFTAKSIVRKKEVEKLSSYYLAGTMVNTTYSILVAFIVTLIVGE